jgi:hypothetical protein
MIVIGARAEGCNTSLHRLQDVVVRIEGYNTFLYMLQGVAARVEDYSTLLMSDKVLVQQLRRKVNALLQSVGLRVTTLPHTVPIQSIRHPSWTVTTGTKF